MSISEAMIDSMMLRINAIAGELWETALIFNRNMKGKKQYAEKKLLEAKKDIQETEEDHHLAMLVKGVQLTYRPQVTLDDLKRYVAQIEGGDYEEAFSGLNEVVKQLRNKYYEKQAQGSYL